MMSADGRYVVVFNGEIYNYLELRAELQQLGARFLSHTDTEVLLEAYRFWGKDCVTRFNGMWALALYDGKEEEVFFSRDRFGIKPLYYCLRNDCLVFASEIKAILAAFPEERRANLPYIRYFLPSGALEADAGTFFENIVDLQPAHCAAYSIRGARLRTWRYWDVDTGAFAEKWLTGDPVERMIQLLSSSVQLHMRSDVPVGSCLSGGIDSSTIVCLMSQMMSNPVLTFSGLYSDSGCDEGQYVELVNKHAHTIPHPVYPEPNGDLLEDLAQIAWHQDEPSTATGLYTQFHVMMAAAPHVKVILDGQGGDELFAGYIPYFLPHIKDLWKANGIEKRALACATLLGFIWRWGIGMALERRNRLRASGARAVEYLWGPSRVSRFLNPDPPLFHASTLAKTEGREISRDRPQKFPGALANRLYWDLTQALLPQLLRYEDRISMAFSIEARVPYLDYRIVEFALALDSTYKIRGTWTKWVLRQAAGNLLPPEIATKRSKLGYPTPMARWLRQDTEKKAAEDLLFSGEFLRRELVDEDAARLYWSQHQSGKVDRSAILYRFIMLELWYRHFIDSLKPCPVKSSQRVAPKKLTP